MKKNLIILLLAILATSHYSFSQWNVMNSGTTKNLNSVHFPSPQVGYAVGTGVIIKSIDSGQNWQIIDSTNDNFRKVFFFDELNGITYHDYHPTQGNARIFLTNDGGVTWDVDSIPGMIKILELTNVEDTLYLVGQNQSNVLLYKSTDLGNTWSILNNSMPSASFFLEMFFVNSLIGYIHTPYAPIRKTTDGGLTWYDVGYPPVVAEIKGGLIFINEDTGFVGGGYSPLFARTTDGGLSWQAINIKNGDMPGTTFIKLNDSKIYGVGSHIYYTGDMGDTWTIHDSLQHAVNDMHIFNEDTILMVGYFGVILKTTSGIGPVGIENNNLPKKKIKIYPNPAKNKIIIEAKEINIYNLEILNQNGKVIKKLNKHIESITTDNLDVGIYIIRFYTDKGLITERIVIVKD